LSYSPLLNIKFFFSKGPFKWWHFSAHFIPLPLPTPSDIWRHFPEPPSLPPPLVAWQCSFYKYWAYSKRFLVKSSSKMDKNVTWYFGWPSPFPMCHLVTLSRPPPPRKKVLLFKLLIRPSWLFRIDPFLNY